jgi:Protein of unknown function (DUF3619)
MKNQNYTAQNLNKLPGQVSALAHFNPLSLEVAQERFGLQVAAHLSDSADALPHDISERLRVARQQAVTKRKLAPAMRTASSVNVSGGAATLNFGDDNVTWWDRIASVIPLIALVAGLIAINVIQNENRARDVAEVDAALLTDDLPPSAYTDPGFVQFLKTRRDLN